MKNNKYEQFASIWTIDDWRSKCPNLEYRVLKRDEMPGFLPSDLLNKFNCALLMASGSNTNQTYVFQGYRVDGDELDEHQYIVTYDLQNQKSYAGFVEHASYDGRTTEIPSEMQISMSLSGVNIAYAFPRKPSEVSGSIYALDSAGLFSGFTNSVNVQNKNH
jgi:hypothetical protein